MRALAIVLAVPHEPELSWLLNKSAAAAGIKSNCGPLIEAARGGWGGGRHDPHAGRTRAHRGKDGDWKHPWLDAVGFERRLTARWSTLLELDRAVLTCAYTEVRFPPETDGKLGSLVAVALLTAAFREAYAEDEGTPMEWLRRACGRAKDARTVEAMRLQALDMVTVAVTAWRASRPGARAVELDEETVRRAALASRDVSGPRRKETPRTWVPLERTRVGLCRIGLTHTHVPTVVVGRQGRRWDMMLSPRAPLTRWHEPRPREGVRWCGGAGPETACEGAVPDGPRCEPNGAL